MLGKYAKDPLLNDSVWGPLVCAALEAAFKVRENAYAPYSKFMVGSAIVTYGGQVFVGLNAETANYDGSHGEEIAIGSMLIGGSREPLLVVSVGALEDTGEPIIVPSCSKCRSHLWEYRSLTGKPFHMVTANAETGRLELTELADLIPKAFGPADVGVDLTKYRR